MRAWVAALFLAGCGSAAQSTEQVAELPMIPLEMVATDAGMVYVVGFIAGTVREIGLARVDPALRSVEIIARSLPLSGFHVGSSRIYLSLEGTPGIVAMPLGGGAIVPVPGSEEAPGLLFADTANLYWLLQAPVRIRALPLDGGVPFTVTTASTGTTWWRLVQNSDSFFAAGLHSVERIPKSGGPPVLLTSDLPTFLDQLAADDGPDLYAADPFSVCRIDLPGGTRHDLPALEPYVEWLAAANGNAFVSQQLGGNYETRHHDLLRIDPSGRVDRLASTGPNGWLLALGPRHVYWTADSALFRVVR